MRTVLLSKKNDARGKAKKYKSVLFFLAARVRSFRFAGSGVILFFRNEVHASMHLIAAVTVIWLAFYLQISKAEWILTIIAIVMVFAAEMFNTCIEKLCDFIHPERHPRIRIIKDLAAGAVLVVALGAAVTGFIIFIPKIFQL